MDADALLGSLVGGRYRVTRKLGEGGMGAVYVAVQEPLGRDVALKVMKWTLTGKASLQERFEREAKRLAKLAHPNIVTLYDFGVDESVGGVGGGGMLYFAMELLPGETLGDRIRREHAIAPKDTIPIVRDIASGLAVAHAAGLVHRDLKPENVMLVNAAGRGTLAKILDFGIAKANDEAERLTNTGVVVGTPGYMAPELAVSGVTDDPRLDFYSLGVVWFEMLTGRSVFDGNTPIALVMKHASEPPPAPSRAAPTAGISAEVDALVLRLLAKSPDERPKTAEDLIALLDGIQDAGTPFLSPPPTGPGPANAATVVPATTFRPFPTTTPPTAAALGPLQATETSLAVSVPSKRSLLVPIAAVAVVALTALAIALFAHTSSPPPPPPPIVAAPPAPPPPAPPPPAPPTPPQPPPPPPPPPPTATTTPATTTTATTTRVHHVKAQAKQVEPKKSEEKTPDLMQ